MIKIYDYTNVGKVFVCGDIHGEFKTLMYHIKTNSSALNDYVLDDHPLEIEEKKKAEEAREIARQERENMGLDDMLIPLRAFRSATLKDCPCGDNKYENSLIFICGDGGIGFNREQYYIDLLGKYNKMLATINATVLFVRGNHDDPSYFANEKINFSHIKTVPDYSIVKTAYYTTLCVGGATSIDRIWRKEQEVRLNKYTRSHKKRLYWEDEGVVINEELLNEILHLDGVKVDSIVSHTAPTFAFPTTKPSCKEWMRLDKALKGDMMAEREHMTFIYNFLMSHESEINWWAYGHFHHNNINKYNNCLLLARGLNIDMADVTQLMKKFNAPKIKHPSRSINISTEVLDRLIHEAQEMENNRRGDGAVLDTIVDGVPAEDELIAPIHFNMDDMMLDGQVIHAEAEF